MKYYIEHCVNCETHTSNTRHVFAKYQEYTTKIEQVIRSVDDNPTICINQTPNHCIYEFCQQNQQGRIFEDIHCTNSYFHRVNEGGELHKFQFPRLGSCELYMETGEGEIFEIFSKIKTRKWPSLSLIKKALCELLEKEFSPITEFKLVEEKKKLVRPTSAVPRNNTRINRSIEAEVVKKPSFVKEASAKKASSFNRSSSTAAQEHKDATLSKSNHYEEGLDAQNNNEEEVYEEDFEEAQPVEEKHPREEHEDFHDTHVSSGEAKLQESRASGNKHIVEYSSDEKMPIEENLFDSFPHEESNLVVPPAVLTGMEELNISGPPMSDAATTENDNNSNLQRSHHDDDPYAKEDSNPFFNVHPEVEATKQFKLELNTKKGKTQKLSYENVADVPRTFVLKAYPSSKFALKEEKITAQPGEHIKFSFKINPNDDSGSYVRYLLIFDEEKMSIPEEKVKLEINFYD